MGPNDGVLNLNGVRQQGQNAPGSPPDPFNFDDWDFTAADRVFVTLVHAMDWKEIGEATPNEPPTAKEYSQAGLAWFGPHGKDQSALPGCVALAGVKSVATLFEKFTGATLPNSEDVETGSPRAIGPGTKGPRAVRTASSWDQ